MAKPGEATSGVCLFAPATPVCTGYAYLRQLHIQWLSKSVTPVCTGYACLHQLRLFAAMGEEYSIFSTLLRCRRTGAHIKPGIEYSIFFALLRCRCTGAHIKPGIFQMALPVWQNPGETDMPLQGRRPENR